MSPEGEERCAACGGSGSKFVQRGDDVLMEQCECSVKNVEGISYFGQHFKGLWIETSGVAGDGEMWTVRILQESDGVITLRRLEPYQMKQACNAGDRPMVWRVIVALISELAKTQKELETTRARLSEVERRIDPLERVGEWIWQVRTAPRRVVEEKLRSIWSQVIRVGVPDF